MAGYEGEPGKKQKKKKKTRPKRAGVTAMQRTVLPVQQQVKRIYNAVSVLVCAHLAGAGAEWGSDPPPRAPLQAINMHVCWFNCMCVGFIACVCCVQVVVSLVRVCVRTARRKGCAHALC